MTIASLAMYPFPELRNAYEQLWDAVRARLTFNAPPLEWEVSAGDAARRADLILGQTCGWPLVTELVGRVQVVGTFDVDVVGAHDGTYRSVLIGSHPIDLIDLLQRPGLRVAANGADSLSGWISLLFVASAAGVELANIEWTGAHVESVAAVRVGRADLASIDSVTWAHLGAPGDLAVLGHGPQVPCLPLITAVGTSRPHVESLRDALADACADPALATVRRQLRIRNFVTRTMADYEPVRSLTELG